MSTINELNPLFTENLRSLLKMNEPDADKESLMTDVMRRTYEIGRRFEMDDASIWTEEAIDYLYESSRHIADHLLGLRLYFIEVSGSLLFSFERGDEWERACQNRSAMEFLFSCYEDNTLSKFLDNVFDMEELDRRLRACGSKENHIQEDDIPKGIPKTHWWWWIPRSILDQK